MMKKIIYLAFIALTVFISSCGEDFLDTQNLTEKDLDNFYTTPQDIDEALAGVYTCLYMTEGVFGDQGLVGNILSDGMLCGGGSDDKSAKRIEFWEDPTEDTYISSWNTNYKGIFRANIIIDRFDQAEYDNEDERNQALGEAHIMRAFFYFRLTQFFGGVPIITDPSMEPNQPRGTIDETYAQIASDLKMAIEIMPRTSATAISSDRLGHTNIWVAEALMARVYLFYTGYSSNVLGQSKDALPLADGGSVSKADVSGWISDMIASSGHALNADPRSNWPYANATNYGYAYGINEGLVWAGEDGANLETVFSIKYSAYGNYDHNAGHEAWVNRLCLYQGIRDNSMVPFGQGWGWNTVNPQLWNAFDDADIRKKGSIIDLSDADEGTAGYSGGKGDHETGYWNKKYTNIQYDAGTGEGIAGMFYFIFGGTKDMQLWHMQDHILIRYADVLLMAAELGVDAQANMDAIRTRANMSSVAPTLENIKAERRLELCFEGLRYYDLLRWGDAESALTAVNVTVSNYGVDEPFNGVYRSETNGLLPIPESQVRLSEGVLIQNPGW